MPAVIGREAGYSVKSTLHNVELHNRHPCTVLQVISSLRIRSSFPTFLELITILLFGLSHTASNQVLLSSLV